MRASDEMVPCVVGVNDPSEPLLRPGQVVCGVEVLRDATVMLGGADQVVTLVEVLHDAAVLFAGSVELVQRPEVLAARAVKLAATDMRPGRVEVLEAVGVAGEAEPGIEKERHTFSIFR